MNNKTIKIIGGKVFTPSGARKATVIIKDGLISEITGDSVEIPDAEVIDAKGMNVVPGGIDIHIPVFDTLILRYKGPRAL